MMMTKGELCELVFDTDDFDVALPQDWVNEMKNLYPDFDPYYWVWDYTEEGDHFGRPRHLLELLNDKKNGTENKGMDESPEGIGYGLPIL